MKCPAGSSSPESSVGAGNCVYPEQDYHQNIHYFKNSKFQGCLLEVATWSQIIRDSEYTVRYKTGGLGKLMIQDEYEVWLCDRKDKCLVSQDMMCYIYNEKSKIFEPVDLQSNLLFASNVTNVTTNSNEGRTESTDSRHAKPAMKSNAKNSDVKGDIRKADKDHSHDAISRLERLEGLLERGLITNDEFGVLKRGLLAKI